MEHPMISNTERYGYPVKEVAVTECGQCHEKLLRGYSVVEYKGEYFCDTHCWSQHLAENEEYNEVIL